ncbi:hypothetical protein COX03_00225 [Candidatus Woesebacteria bacterium CG22_combo_CG10-13_8_21_14_all_39_10]|uniref:Uncharacterized protein n=1 Tax=Candidatus Woesebacteria bacterium CG22_combo_CG10-13_8_21_14_all_39_10 TaxID=1975059 RepID=A0A2H0BJY9_9BACT|nr:MAG: hypothetical protein COX03_00225 [Candidatus Woesebacteria bacterium CG22_combo_CG10-13_8_21_14_all_39_10]
MGSSQEHFWPQVYPDGHLRDIDTEPVQVHFPPGPDLHISPPPAKDEVLQEGGLKLQLNEAVYPRSPERDLAKRLSPLFDLTSTVVQEEGGSTATSGPVFSSFC